MLTTMTADELDETFAALSDRTRRAILQRLAQGEASVLEIAKPFAMSLPAISRHLKVLEKAGLVTRGRDAQWRPCRLRAEPLGQASEWIGQYRQHWEERFDRLENYLNGIDSKEKSHGSSSRKKR
jgi:DNA-binding transcriptional ArsR family regulator